MPSRYIPRFRFVLADKHTGMFPKIDTNSLISRELTDSLGDTYVFDDRNDPKLKKDYYNALYKGIAEFEPFIF
jgi:hypothetical protein